MSESVTNHSLLGRLKEMLPENGQEMNNLLNTRIDPEHVIEGPIKYLFKQCSDEFFSDNYKACIAHSDILIDITWERLNTGYWKDVNIVWRYFYTLLSTMKMFSELAMGLENGSNEDQHEKTMADVMKTCDMGLLMGAPILDNILAKMSSVISENGNLNPTDLLSEQSDRNSDYESASKKPKLSSESYEESCILFGKSDKATEIQRLRGSSISLESFRKTFVEKKEPLIITEAIDYWPAMSTRRWSLDYIKKIAGYRTVPIELGSKYTEESWSQTLMTINEFVTKYIEEVNVSEKGYLAQHQLFNQVPELEKDISVPTFCCVGESEDVDINAWFGPKGTVSPLHYDDKENLLAQVMGSKYIRLYSDEFTDQIYPNPHRLLHNTSQIDIEDVDTETYPLFPSTPYWECVLKPGELLFIPSKYWHFVKSLSVSFSVSFWWK